MFGELHNIINMFYWIQVDRANADLKNTNVRLKETVNQVKIIHSEL